jgi:hypothetical protein
MEKCLRSFAAEWEIILFRGVLEVIKTEGFTGIEHREGYSFLTEVFSSPHCVVRLSGMQTGLTILPK